MLILKILYLHGIIRTWLDYYCVWQNIGGGECTLAKLLANHPAPHSNISRKILFTYVKFVKFANIYPSTYSSIYLCIVINLMCYDHSPINLIIIHFSDVLFMYILTQFPQQYIYQLLQLDFICYDKVAMAVKLHIMHRRFKFDKQPRQ